MSAMKSPFGTKRSNEMSFMGVPPPRLAAQAAPDGGVMGAPASNRRKNLYTFAALAFVGIVGASVALSGGSANGNGDSSNIGLNSGSSSVGAQSAPPTSAPTVCLDKVDVIFVLDESLSIEPADFANMQTFVTQLVEEVKEQTPFRRFALTLFDDKVRTEIKLGDDKSLNVDDFNAHVTGLVQGNGLTCTAGALHASFRANFGPLTSDGEVDPDNTLLKSGYRTVFFLVTDGQPTASINDDVCFNEDGNCQCGTGGSLESKTVYNAIKDAATQEYQNTVISLGIGHNVETAFLEEISDRVFSVDDMKLSSLEAIVGGVADAISCRSGTSSPTFTISD